MWGVLNQYISKGIQLIVHVGDELLRPSMLGIFLGAIGLRLLIYFTVKAEAAFASEFEKRVHKHLSDPDYEGGITSFHELARRLLLRTHEEYYNLKRKYRRRRFDQLTALAERLFLICEGATRLINDTLSQTKYLRKDGHAPRFVEMSKFVFESNPVFNRVLGIFPLGMCNDILNILPGLFVVLGIFGTFLGVMAALPALSAINLNDPAGTKLVMDGFLLKMAFSMGNSIIGIFFSVIVQILNAMLNPEAIYYSMVNKFTSSLEFLWNDTTTNVVNETSVPTTDRRKVHYSNQKKAAVPPEDQALSAIPEIPPVPVEDDRVVILRHRLETLNSYIEKADQDKASGVMPQEMWEEERAAYLEERERLEHELAELEDSEKAA